MKTRSYISLIAVVLALLGTGSAFAAGLLIPQGQSSSLDIRDHKVNVVVEDGYAGATSKLSTVSLSPLTLQSQSSPTGSTASL